MNLLEKTDLGISYYQYIEELELQLAEKKGNEKILNYVYLNLKRMKRIHKQYEPAPFLKNLVMRISKPITWLVITEGWCGDAAHVLPVLEKLTQFSFKPTMKIVLRDEHPELMELFLTNGSRSIPKVLAIDEEGELISEWGPRPGSAQQMVESFKDGNSEFTNYEQLSEALQKWYHYDRYLTFESEIIDFIEPQIQVKVMA